MNQNLIRKNLYEKYIEPTKKKREKFIGIEIEMPILNLNKKPVDFTIIHEITKNFMKQFGFDPLGIDQEGNVYSAIDEKSGDILSFDCSYNNLELSLGKQRNLHTIYEHFTNYYNYLQKEFQKYQYTLTGMGVNPYRKYNHNVPIPTGRYQMLFHHLESYKNYNLPMYFHEYPTYGMFSSASQVQLDVDHEDLLLTLNTFSKLEPIKALLFSNSVLLDEHEELLCCRDMFWENSTHGINPHNIGMFDCEFESEEELLAYIESTSIYCVEREEKYINFPPINIMEYFKKTSIRGEYFEDGKYKEIEIQPTLDDLKYLRTFKFEDLTFRGTIEFRSVCCQPIKDCMTVAAFHLGLKQELNKLANVLNQDKIIYQHGYTPTELRRLFVKNELPIFVNEDELYELTKKIVDIAKQGLVARGFGEETMLDALYDRINERTNPAKKMMQLRAQGIPMEEIVLKYGQI